MGKYLNPVTVVTTLQPMLLAWLAAIAFFVTLAIVAILSRGRQWYELACLFLILFVGFASTNIFVANWVLDVRVVEFNAISMGEPYDGSDGE